jgi:hypothetical protein
MNAKHLVIFITTKNTDIGPRFVAESVTHGFLFKGEDPDRVEAVKKLKRIVGKSNAMEEQLSLDNIPLLLSGFSDCVLMGLVIGSSVGIVIIQTEKRWRQEHPWRR